MITYDFVQNRHVLQRIADPVCSGEDVRRQVLEKKTGLWHGKRRAHFARGRCDTRSKPACT